MTDLSIQFRILYHLYDSFNKREQITVKKLKQKEFAFLTTDEYQSELLYLAKANYLTIDGTGYLELTALGICTTEILFGKFLEYIKQDYREELSSFIKTFEYYNNQRKKQISEIYFSIYREPKVKKAFVEYLSKVNRIENVESFESQSVPNITIVSSRASIFSFGVSAYITGLRPNSKYEIWHFYPDGAAIGGQTVYADSDGKLQFPQNLSDAPLHSSSHPIPKGEYILGINEGLYKPEKKHSFHDWQKSNLDKTHVTFNVDYNKVTTLHLDEITRVPWGVETVISGQLWFKDEPFGRQVVPAG